ncbi:MAG: hypothetical protein O3A95_05010 [Planctomycetota bacterium]|nr:hypothetical protein [Planctomycetota bacterium]MDA1113644.1 hypothetical protein [Planctomycetota bacterium]
MLSLVLASMLHFAPMPMAQDPVEFGRLATEQRQVAEQVRRLGQLLEMLEKRDLEEGRTDRAELLLRAREKLKGAEETGTLAAAIDGVARELTSLHSGNALEGQAELIQTLQDLLDHLVESERREREMALEKAMLMRAEALQEFSQRQENLMQQTQKLQDQQEAKEQKDMASTDPANPNGETEKPNGETPPAQEELDAKREELAELQNRLAEELEKFNREQEEQTGRRSLPSKKAEDASEEAAQKMRPQSAETKPQDQAEQLDKAIAKQKEALEELKKAQKQIEDQQERSDEEKRREALLDVMREAQVILDRHMQMETELADIVVNLDDEGVPRSTRTHLRQISLAQNELSIAAEDLLLTIDQAGADSFPLYIQGLSQDHGVLSKEIGPPRYRLNRQAMPLAAALTKDWQQLIEVIRIEQERIRKRLEEPPSEEGQAQEAEDQEEKELPLVNFAMELHLLKRMQESLAERLALMEDRQIAFADAGIPFGPEDALELEMLLNRQSELYLQFESMVERLQQAKDETASEDL